MYEKKLFAFLDKYEEVIKGIVNVLSKITLYVASTVESIAFKLIDVFESLYTLMRYTTIPLHWIWIRLEISRYQKNNEVTELPFFEPGAHYWYGKPGSGKSTSVYHAMMQHSYYTGKCALTTEPMETAREDLSGFKYFYHQLFSPGDYYEDGNQIYGFPEGFDKIIFEEMLAQKINQRNAKSSSHNNVVIPLIESMGTQRHQGIQLFYFISQLPRNDIQIMLMLKGYHVPKIIKRFNYGLWLKTGKIRWTVKGWRITSYDVEPKGGSDYQLINKRRYFYEMTLEEDFAYFNRFNLQAKYAKLEKAKGVTMYA